MSERASEIASLFSRAAHRHNFNRSHRVNFSCELSEPRGEASIREGRDQKNGHSKSAVADPLGNEVARQQEIRRPFGTSRRDRTNARWMVRAAFQAKLPYGVEEKRKRVAGTDEDEAIVRIPLVARIPVVVVQPRLAIIVAFHLEHVAVTVRVRCVQGAARATAPRMLSGLYRICDL